MKLDLELDGMHCDGCVRRVKSLLSKVEGVTAEVTLGRAILEVDSETTATAARERLEKAGYAVRASR